MAVTSWNLGSDVLYRDGAYLTNLAQARAGTAPFFLLTVLLTGLLAARAAGVAAGALAAIAVATLPPMLAHVGLATTDVGFVAMFLLAIWTFVRWLEQPSLPRSALLGAAVALALLTKLTTLLFFPITAGALALGHWRAVGDRAHGGGRPSARLWLRGAALAAGLVLLTGWAGAEGCASITSSRGARPEPARWSPRILSRTVVAKGWSRVVALSLTAWPASWFPNGTSGGAVNARYAVT